MDNQIFSTIHTIAPVSDWFAVYAADEAPFYQVSRLPCLVAGRAKSFSRKTQTWEEDTSDTLAFMDVCADGTFDDPTDMSNFLEIAHERDIDDAQKARWSQLGQAYLAEKTNAA